MRKLLLSVMLFFCGFGSLAAQCDPVSDSLALVALYNSTDGPNWFNNTNWLVPGQPIGTWDGIDTDGDGCVLQIQLNFNQLSGPIPTELGNLFNLNFLYLNNNQLSGEIPAELGNFSNLNFLYLNNNQLNGEIPAELGNLSNLNSLYLNSNQLSGLIPVELGNLSNLNSLYLSDNQLSGPIPTELGNLFNLNFLYLNNNQLSGEIPAELGNFSNLNFLYLNNNQLNGEIPAELGNLSNLNSLYLNSNQLSGEIPTELGNLSNLVNFISYANELSGPIPAELGNLDALIQLFLDNNQLNGEIPTELGNLSNLNFLFLNNNQLSGPIPAELGNLDALIQLFLEYNQLSGPIPVELGNLSNLVNFKLNNNQLSGFIPAELGNLSNLNWLHLNNNQLSGSIPPELGNLVNLNQLGLHNNQLEGCYPDEIGIHCFNAAPNLSNNPALPWSGYMGMWCMGEEQIGAPCDDGNPNTVLDQIDMDCNCLGQVCNPLSDSLVLIDLYNNTDGLNWVNPWDLGMPMINWEGVKFYSSGCVKSLTLLNRNLNGALPLSLGELTFLDTFIISGNPQLGGSLPPSIGNLSFLKLLNVSNNNLSNTIPPDIGDLCETEEMYINDNNFSGCLPPELSQLENLRVLTINNNNFSCDSYPTELITLCFLDSLNLDNNLSIPDFDAFCDGGAFAEICDEIQQDSLNCIDTLQSIILQLGCNEYFADSSLLINVATGLVEINNISFAYVTRSVENAIGNMIDTTLFVGCAGLVIEECISSSNSIHCIRGVLDSLAFTLLDFQESWNCAEQDPGCIPTNISMIDPVLSFEAFPNPLSDHLTILMSEEVQNYEVLIYDLLGRLVLQRFCRSSQTILDTSKLNTGIFILKLSDDDGRVVSSKLVKQ